MLYKIYVTDSLKAITGTKERFYDMISDTTPHVKKSAEEVKQGILDAFKKLEGK